MLTVMLLLSLTTTKAAALLDVKGAASIPKLPEGPRFAFKSPLS
jgi:hypothetical protein